MDYLAIKGLCFSGVHGVYPKERGKPQSFFIDLKLGCDLTLAAGSDNLEDTVDWGWVRKEVRKVIEEDGSCNLVETLAGRICSRLLVKPKILSVQVIIRKQEAWDNGVPEVQMLRLQPNP
jgi:dihydroneopterin aldolase